MLKLSRKVGAIVAVFIGVGILGVWLCFQCRSVFCTAMCGQFSGEEAQAEVAAYVRAIARGDEGAAYAVWELPSWEGYEGWHTALSERRQSVTGKLMAAGIDSDFTILNVEWWRTCCEPGVILNPREAGGVRFRVKLWDRDGSPLVYIFDVFVRGVTYWGAAAGYPPRHWMLRDVYPPNQEPLFWRWVFEPSARHLGWPPRTPQPSQ